MSLIQQIKDTLLSLSTDSKRKHGHIRKASQRSLQILKSFPIHSVSDNKKQLDSLKDYPDFVDPFLLCFHTKETKLVSFALTALNKLVVSKAISFTKIDEIIAVLQDLTYMSTEVQLKILQILPTLFENYSMDINDESLSNILYVCTLLQNSTKSPVVVNTAKATFSQMIGTVFEKVKQEKELLVSKKITGPARYTLPIDNDKTVKVHLCAYDAQRVFNDLCTLIEHHKPVFLKTNYMTEDDGFEILESTIKNNEAVFKDHVELAYLLRIRVAPILLRFISSCDDFTLMVRVFRLVFLMISDLLEITTNEAEVTLSLMTHLISSSSKTPKWKRIFCLEIYASIFKDFKATKTLFKEFDDNQEVEKRQVVHDFLTVCVEIIGSQHKMLNSGDIVQPPNGDGNNRRSSSGSSSTLSLNGQGGSKDPHSTSTPLIFSVYPSEVKQRYMDSIDKMEPPAMPDYYMLSLVAQCVTNSSEGIFNYSLNLARDFQKGTSKVKGQGVTFLDESLMKKYGGATELIEYRILHDFTLRSWESLYSILKVLIVSSLDNKSFSLIIQSLQRLCHASGILSVRKAQTTIINYFAYATVNLTGQLGYHNKIQSFGESIAGTISSAIGQAVSNMSHNARSSSETGTNISTDTSTNSRVKWYPRTINSRQIICFRALVDLGISLAELFDDSWRTLMIVFQWISYYIDGPTGFSAKEIPPISPLLDNHDISVISETLKKFSNGIGKQDYLVFRKICNSLFQLSDEISKQPVFGSMVFSPVKEEGYEIYPCIYCRSFFVAEISNLCLINPLKFLINENGIWDDIVSFFSNICTDRELEESMRLLFARSFGEIIQAVANVGFDDNVAGDDDERTSLYSLTERGVLKALLIHTQKLLDLKPATEVLTINVELRIVLSNLNILKDIIDRFGNKISEEWDAVFSLLDVPFKISGDTSYSFQESSTKEMLVSLMKSSFESLKVTLDELLQTVPLSQIRIVIDILFKFVTQRYDLNASFNAASYFWIISDYLKDSLNTYNETSIGSTQTEINSERQLVSIVKAGIEPDNNKKAYIEFLWLYLLLKLAETTNDKRAQVRNGSIITFFNVLDSYSEIHPSYNSIYAIILEPILLQILPDNKINECPKAVQEEWIATLSSVSSSLTKFYCQRLGNFNVDKKSSNELQQYWHGYSVYMTKLLNINNDWMSLNTKNFENLLKVFNTFSVEGTNVPSNTVEDFYSLWTEYKIVYKLSDDSSYEELLCAFVSCFIPLFNMVGYSLSISKLESLLMQLNSCVRFPVLIANKRDDKRMTKLQQKVLDSLSNMSFEEPQYQSLLIRELCSIIALPFTTRDLIQKKLGSKGLRIPTFRMVSYNCLKVLEKCLSTITQLVPFLVDHSILQLYDSLLEPCKLKYRSDAQLCTGEYLWKGASSILCDLSCRICESLISDAQSFDDQKLRKQDFYALWSRILKFFESCFLSCENRKLVNEFQSFDLEISRRLEEAFSRLIREKNPATFTDENRRKFLSCIWRASFLYSTDDASQEVLNFTDSPLEISKRLSLFKTFKYCGNTSTLTPVVTVETAKLCLHDLIDLSAPGSGPLWKLSLEYYIGRFSFALAKYISDFSLCGKRPMPRMQGAELEMLLIGYLRMVNHMKQLNSNDFDWCKKSMHPLYQLISLLPSLNIHDRKLGALVTSVFHQLPIRSGE